MRLARGWSQGDVGAQLGLSFQQIQKYEWGRNRIPASTLMRLGQLFDEPLSSFVEDKASDAVAPPGLDSQDASAVLASFANLGGARLRTQMLRLMNEIGSQIARPLDRYVELVRELFEAFPFAVYVTDASGVVTYCNPACEGFAGRAPRVGVDRWSVAWRLFDEKERLLPDAKCPMAVAMASDSAVRTGALIAERPDGSRIKFRSYPTPLHDQHGRIVGGLNLLEPLEDPALGRASGA